MSRHVVIVGAGAVGLCTALYCARRGWRVTVVDRQGEERDGCSYGNAGMVVPSHFTPLASPGAVAQGLRWMLRRRSPFYIRPRVSWDLIDWMMKFWRASNPRQAAFAAPLLRDLNLASRRCFDELAIPLNDFAWSKNGALMLCKTRRAMDEESHIAERAARLGIPAEILDADATAAREPDVRMDVVGSVYFALDGSVVPRRFMSSMQQRLRDAGVQFAWSTPVNGWQVDSRRRIRGVRAPGGALIEGDEFVLAAGAWSSGLSRKLSVTLPMQAGKGYSVTLAKPPKMPRLGAICTEARVSVSPMQEMLRFAGTLEITGLDETIDADRVRAIVEAVPRYYPDFTAGDFDRVVPWRGLRPCSPDGLPYIGRSARHPNLVVATGHAMMGMSLAPITGSLVAQVIGGERTPFDIEPLSPDRYH
ncbi:MAG TPA: FAD-dependent oxidoreductase [Casimicrobiaceae bacterium]|nr:FAD-dependent oxidoreductase [Casimicrobiaceae bacterium]